MAVSGVVTIAVDRGYESALADKQLVVESDEGDDDTVTRPIGVVHDVGPAGVTVPIPTEYALVAMLHNISIPSPTTTKSSATWARFAIGVAAGIATVVGIFETIY